MSVASLSPRSLQNYSSFDASASPSYLDTTLQTTPTRHVLRAKSSAAVAHSRREFGTSSLWRHAARRCARSRSGVSFRVPLAKHFSINWRTYGLFFLHCSQCYMGSISSMRLWLVHMKKIIRKSPKDTNFRRAVGIGLTSMRIRCSWCPQWCSQMLHQHCIKMSWPEHCAFYFYFYNLLE